MPHAPTGSGRYGQLDAAPDDLHEWLSFEADDEYRTFVFDVTFLTSSWDCIYGRGCPGVLTGPAEELEQGCCSYGAHFTGAEDRARVEAKIAELGEDEWQHRDTAAELGGAIHQNEDDEVVTRQVDGACIMLNRPGFPAGAGCALHQAAVARDERPLDWKPDVCWQLPLRLVEETDEHGYVTSTLREWKRRDWGDGGQEFHWWCTEDALAFVGRRPVIEVLRDEIIELVGPAAYATLVDVLDARPKETLLPHPALKKQG